MAKGVTIDLIVDPKQALAGIDKVADKASSATGSLAGLGKAAAATFVVLGTAAIGAVAGLAAMTKGAGEYAESVALAASETHLSTDAVQELKYAASVTGVEFETITGSMTKLTKSMGAAQAGTGAQAEAFAELGVATTDANGDLLDSTVVYDQVIKALGQVENPAERDVLAMTLLGKSARDLNPLIDGSAGSLEELAAQAREAGAVLTEDMLAKLGSVDDAFDQLQLGADAAKNALGLTLLPVLQDLGDQGTGLLGRFTNAVLKADGDLSKAAPEIGAVFSDAVTLILDQVPKMLEVGTSIISSILSGIAERAPSLIAQAIPVLAGFVTTLLGQLPVLVDAGLKVVVALAEGVADALPQLIPAAVAAVIGIVQALVANLPLLLDAGLQLITGLVTGIISALPTLVAALPGIITSIVSFLTTAIPTIIETGITLLLALVDALPAVIDGLVTALPTVITAVVVALATMQPQLIQAGIALFLGLIKALPTIISSTQSAVPKIVTGLVQAFTSPSTIASLSRAGVALMQAFIDGIRSQIAAIGSAVGGIMDFVAGFFPHSPAEHGPFSGSGWTQIGKSGLAIANQFSDGLESGLSRSNVSSIMSGLSGQVSATVAADARVSFASGAATTAGAVYVNVTVPITDSLIGDTDFTARQIARVTQEAVRTAVLPSNWAQA